MKGDPNVELDRIRDQSRERNEYVRRFNRYPQTGNVSWLSSFLGERVVDHLHAGNLLSTARTSEYLTAARASWNAAREFPQWCELQIDRAIYKVEWALAHGLTVDQLFGADLNAAIYPLGFTMDDGNYPGDAPPEWTPEPVIPDPREPVGDRKRPLPTITELTPAHGVEAATDPTLAPALRPTPAAEPEPAAEPAAAPLDPSAQLAAAVERFALAGAELAATMRDTAKSLRELADLVAPLGVTELAEPAEPGAPE